MRFLAVNGAEPFALRSAKAEPQWVLGAVLDSPRQRAKRRRH